MNRHGWHTRVCVLCVCVALCCLSPWYIPAAQAANPLVNGLWDKTSILELLLRRTPKSQCREYVEKARDANNADHAAEFFWLNKYEEQQCAVENLNDIVWGRLGWLYNKGLGTPQNIDKAIHYYTKNAELGDVADQYFLGNCLIEHKKDYKQGLYWMEKAALSGDADAQFALGILYDDQQTPVFNVEKAFKFFEMCTKQGDVDCSYELGLMYYYGEGTAEDTEKALELLKYAAERGEENAAFYCSGILFSNFELTETRLEEAYFWLEVSKYFGAEFDEGLELEKEILATLSPNSKKKIDELLPARCSEIGAIRKERMGS